jgi:ABC-type multidrug transport system fused ATPase/permease subunit
VRRQRHSQRLDPLAVADNLRFLRALIAVLTPAQRRRYAVLQAYFLLAGVMQVAGAGSIAPFVALLSDPTILQRHPVAHQVYVALGFTSNNEALVAFAFAMMGVLAVSNIIAAGAVWLIFRFSLRLGAEIQRDLFVSFLYRDYVELARMNSATLIATITQGATRFTYNVVQPLMVLTSQAMIVLTVIVVLTIYQPSVALSFAILIGGGYGLLFTIVRKQLVRHGNHSYGVHQKKQQLLAEGLGGLKEIRLAGTEAHYHESYEATTRSGQRSEAIVGLLSDLPRFVLETLAFCALLWLAIILLRSSASSSDVVAVLSLYAMTGYRVLPAAQSIFKSAAQIRANAAVTYELLPDIVFGRQALERASGADGVSAVVPAGPIELRDVWFQYPEGKAPVLRGVSVDILPNQLTVLVGHSGSGKSTMADLLLGLLRPSQGTVTVGGCSVDSLGKAWQRRLGYVPQSIFVLDESVAANIAFGSPLGIDEVRVREAARLARFDSVIEGLPGGVHYRVGERGSMLSGGQRQRLGIARALYHDAQLLVLDEATSALDGATENEVLDTLLELRKNRAVIMIAHRMSTIRAADRILLLHDGSIEAEGTYDELLQTNDRFRRMALRAEDVGSPEAESVMA